MIRNRARVFTTLVLVGMGASPLFVGCGKMGSLPGGVPGAGKCPDMANVSAVTDFDWAGTFKMDATASGKLKSGLAAAIHLKGIAAQIDADLVAACGGLAKDLGASGDFRTGEQACKAAMDAMGAVKAKFGAKAKIVVDIAPPVCSASMNAMAECSGKCDASVQGGKAEVKCEGGEISGTCEGKCEGKCEMSAAATCEGTCEGTCEAEFKGTCGGKCDGKCNGKNTSGECNGTCQGKCESGASGKCKGGCSGSCELEGSADCSGTCSGTCSVEMKEPKCSGTVEPPQVSADCKAQCDAEVSGKLECTPARVVVKVTGSADAAAAAQFKAALEKNLAGVVKVAVGMKDRIEGVVASVQGVVEGAQAAVQASASAGPAVAAQLSACVAAPLKGAFDAAASVKANVNVSVNVQASASASGSASGKSG